MSDEHHRLLPLFHPDPDTAQLGMGTDLLLAGEQDDLIACDLAAPSNIDRHRSIMAPSIDNSLSLIPRNDRA
jgi:hypothetical protein